VSREDPHISGHVPILALMHSMLHNDYLHLASTTKPEMLSHSLTLASYLCSTEPSIGVWKDAGKMTYSSFESQPTPPTSVSTLDSTLCIAVKDEWTGFEVSLCWVKEDWSKQHGT
jgi:hypothetical protein